MPNGRVAPVVRGRNVRVWLSTRSATPSSPLELNPKIYAGDIREPGISTSFKSVPDPTSYGDFRIYARTPVASSTPITGTIRSMLDGSGESLLAYINRAKCSFDMAWFFGTTGNPSDPFGYDKVEYFERCTPVSYFVPEVGAYKPDDATIVILDEMEFICERTYTHSGFFSVWENQQNNGNTLVGDPISVTRPCASDDCLEVNEGEWLLAPMRNNDNGQTGIAASFTSGYVWRDHSIDPTRAYFPLQAATSAVVSVGDIVFYSNSGQTGGGDDYYTANINDVRLNVAVWNPPTANVATSGFGNLIHDGTKYLWGLAAEESATLALNTTAIYRVRKSGILNGEPVELIYRFDGQRILVAFDGYNDDLLLAVGTNGELIKYDNGVVTLSSPIGPTELTDVVVYSRNRWVIYSKIGTIATTYNGGISWETIQSPGSGDIIRVFPIGDGLTYALIRDALDNYYLGVSTNGGDIFSRMILLSTQNIAGANDRANGLYVSSDGRIVSFVEKVLVGGYIYRSWRNFVETLELKGINYELV